MFEETMVAWVNRVKIINDLNLYTDINFSPVNYSVAIMTEHEKECDSEALTVLISVTLNPIFHQ